MPETPSLSAGAAKARAAAAEPAELPEQEPLEDQAPQIMPVQTAFLVLWVNGQVIVTPDLDSPVVVDHYPTADEILGAAAVLASDRTGERTALMIAQQLPALVATATLDEIAERQRQVMQKIAEQQSTAQGQALLAAEQAGKLRA